MEWQEIVMEIVGDAINGMIVRDIYCIWSMDVNRISEEER